jgi:orotidine-5'-phosphate decarboxylase
MIPKIEKVILALDNMDVPEIKSFLSNWPISQKPMIKIGLELFYKYGRSLIFELHKEFGTKIFLDLKLHDIPNTVAKAIRSLEGLPIDLLTVHLSGGEEMLKRALEEAKQALPQTKILGVSLLTSLDDKDLFTLWNIPKENIDKTFENLFLLAIKTGLHGVVCSPQELHLFPNLEEKTQTSLLKVTPGIRFNDEINSGETQDQKRVMAPEQAIKSGANYLVIGRSLTKSKNLDKRIEHLANLN